MSEYFIKQCYTTYYLVVFGCCICLKVLLFCLCKFNENNFVFIKFYQNLLKKVKKIFFSKLFPVIPLFVAKMQYIFYSTFFCV